MYACMMNVEVTSCDAFPAVWAPRWGQRSNEGVFFFLFVKPYPLVDTAIGTRDMFAFLLSAHIYIRVTSLEAEIITTPVQRHFNAMETIIIHVLLLFFCFLLPVNTLLTLIKAASPRRLRPQRFLSHDHHCHIGCIGSTRFGHHIRRTWLTLFVYLSYLGIRDVMISQFVGNKSMVWFWFFCRSSSLHLFHSTTRPL